MCSLYFLCSHCFSKQKTVLKKNENKKNIEHIFGHNLFFEKHEREQTSFLQNTKIILSVFSKNVFKNRFKKQELNGP